MFIMFTLKLHSAKSVPCLWCSHTYTIFLVFLFFILLSVHFWCKTNHQIFRMFNSIRWFLCYDYWNDVHWHCLNNNTYSTIDVACSCSTGYYDYFYYYCVYDNDTDSFRMRMYPVRRYQCDFGFCYYSSTLILPIHEHIDDYYFYWAYDLNCYYIDSY